MSEVLKRPTDQETDDDLLQMQEEWSRSQNKQKPSVEIHKMKKRTKIEPENSNLVPNPDSKDSAGNSKTAPKKKDYQAARFQLDLEENQQSQVLFGVCERSSAHSELKIEEFQRFSQDDGFPEPLDLSDYYKPKNGRSLRSGGVPRGKSFFAQEFDRLHGNLEENLDFQAENLEEKEDIGPGNSGDFQSENEKFLNSLDREKILEMKLEITERFDPKLLEFLKSRGGKKNPEEPAKKVSKFKASRAPKKGAEPKKAELQEKGEEPKGAEPVTKEVEEMMNELEVLEEWENREDQEKYNRLATDAIQMDLTAKFSRNLAQRQEKNAVKLFDNCKFRPDSEGPMDPFLEQARSSIDQIKRLYLEEHLLPDGTVIHQFGKGLNPILDSCWSLIPIRNVLDTVEKRQGHVEPDDVEIVRLSILWTFLMFSEKKSAFFAFSEPNNFYVHLSEIFLIGSEILADDVITECTRRLLDDYLFENAAKSGKISLRMSGKVAGLDAFMPFFENLLRNYEQYSMGNVDFAKAILIGAYLNAPIGDSLEYRFALWSPKRNTIRQMTISTATCRSLLDAIKKQHMEREKVIYEQHYVQYCSLLGAYVSAIRDNVITRDRNQLMFDIASFEIGKFMESQKKSEGAKGREFQILVDIIQKSIGDKLMIL